MSPHVENRSLDSLVAEVQADNKLPGAAAIVLSSEGTIAQSVAGLRKLGAPAKLTLHDRFHMGSNIKAMTATMVATLVEQGRLSWTTTLATALPELAPSMDSRVKSITLEQLLTHRSGLRAFVDLDEGATLPDFSGTPSQQRLAFAAWLLAQPPAVPQGTYLYSNAGYAIAGVLAERAAGQSFETLMQERLYSKLGISAKLGWPAFDNPNEPWGHEDTGAAYVPVDPRGEFQLPPLLAPAGDINMTLEDYAKFVLLHLRSLRGSPSLLSQSTFDKLHTPNGEYAFGWIVAGDASDRIYLHGGSVGTFWVIAAIRPSQNRAAILATNAGGERAALAAQNGALAALSIK